MKPRIPYRFWGKVFGSAVLDARMFVFVLRPKRHRKGTRFGEKRVTATGARAAR